MLKTLRMQAFLILGLWLVTQNIFGFVVQKIEIEGLQGFSKETILNYVPVKVGDNFSLSRSREVIRELYETGFFENVTLFKQQNTLLIKVVQRPIITRITIVGNKAIPTKSLMEALGKMGFTEGQVYNPSLLEEIKSSLAREYFSVGHYGAEIKTTVTRENPRLVIVRLDIHEGVIAKIRQLKIIGNYAFNEKELLKLFKLSRTGLFSFVSHNDQYSREKLEADLENLRAFYMDAGYLKFKVDSTQISISSDHSEVYIVIHIVEGVQYRLSGYRYSGELILPEAELQKLTPVKTGDLFSRRDIMAITRRISFALGERGYANADVQVVPQFDEVKQTVFITFQIKSGSRLYVRRITFSDHYRTNDETLRRRLLHQEGGVFATTKIESSKRNLLMLPYIRDVGVSSRAVPETPDQVDVNYKLQEQSAAEMHGSLGYSQLDKLLLSFGFNHRNVMGTGNTLGINLMHSSPRDSLNMSFYNPYYTASGIGRNFSIYASRFNGEEANISNYTMDQYGADMGYTFPIARDDHFSISLGFEQNLLKVGNHPSAELSHFIEDHGRHFYQLSLSGGWSHQGFDRSIFPKYGLMQSLSGMVTIPFEQDALRYYRAGYTFVYYHPLLWNFVGQVRGHATYGDGYGSFSTLPIIKHLYEGGVGSVRGYTGNSLGPQDSMGEPLGGNASADGTLGLILPRLFTDNVRTTLFIDGGNVWLMPRQLDSSGEEYYHSGPVRFSCGIAVDWLSPIGILNLSLAKPLNKQTGDEEEPFQLTFGTTF